MPAELERLIRHHYRRVHAKCVAAARTRKGLDPNDLFQDVLLRFVARAPGWFERPPGQNSPWLEENPLAVASEREALVLRQGLPVHRALYERNRQPLPAADSP